MAKSILIKEVKNGFILTLDPYEPNGARNFQVVEEEQVVFNTHEQLYGFLKENIGMQPVKEPFSKQRPNVTVNEVLEDLKKKEPKESSIFCDNCNEVVSGKDVSPTGKCRHCNNQTRLINN